MSSPDVEVVRAKLVEVAALHPDGFVGIVRDAKLGVSDEALRLFAIGKTKTPGFLGVLAMWLDVWKAPSWALVDAERALHAIQQAYSAQERVVSLLRAGLSADDAEAISAADKPLVTPNARPGAAKGKKAARAADG